MTPPEDEHTKAKEDDYVVIGPARFVRLAQVATLFETPRKTHVARFSQS